MVFGQTQLDQAWDMHFTAVKAFVEQTGKPELPKDLCDTDGVNLKIWMRRQLASMRNGKLAADKAAMLRQLGFAPAIEDPFDVGYAHAKAYYEAFGNLLVQTGYVCDDGYRLASWAANTRQNRKKNKLTSEQIRLLDSIGMIWDVNEFVWNEMFEAAKA